VTDDTNSLKGFLYDKLAQRKKRIHPEHSPRFNHDMQLEIDCYEWVLGKVEVNKIPFDRLERIIKATITIPSEHFAPITTVNVYITI
jgi:hypothetical protein